MNSLRKDWTFPIQGGLILEAVIVQLHSLDGANQEEIKKLSIELNVWKQKKLGLERSGLSPKEVLRVIGNQPFAKPSSVETYTKELAAFGWALAYDLNRDPHRLYKLNMNDLIYFKIWDVTDGEVKL